MEMISAGFTATVFAAGLLSFFSPCVLPLLPIYMGYLSTEDAAAEGNNTTSIFKALAFTAGISTSFVILGFGAGALGGIVNSPYFFLACAVLVIMFGLHQSGLAHIALLNTDKRPRLSIAPQKGLLGSFALGFLFSFGWSPCVGPILGAVLGLSSQQGGAVNGGWLLFIYSLGLSLPFMALALGSRHLLQKIKGIYPYLSRMRLVGGLLIIAMGVWMLSAQIPAILADSQNRFASINAALTVAAHERAMPELHGRTAGLAELKGKAVYIKFWTTWCPLCLAGLEDMNILAARYDGSGEAAVVSVVTPGINGEVSTEDFIAWAQGQGIAFPVFFDETGALTQAFAIKAYPSSVYLDKQGNFAKKIIGDESVSTISATLSSLIMESEL